MYKRQPLANASITVKGSRSGTASGADGTFSLTVPDNVKMLTVSAVGYETLDVAISGSFVSVALQTGESRSMDEVIVVGYGTRIKKDLTGNIARVKGTEVALSLIHI